MASNSSTFTYNRSMDKCTYTKLDGVHLVGYFRASIRLLSLGQWPNTKVKILLSLWWSQLSLFPSPSSPKKTHNKTFSTHHIFPLSFEIPFLLSFLAYFYFFFLIFLQHVNIVIVYDKLFISEIVVWIFTFNHTT